MMFERFKSKPKTLESDKGLKDFERYKKWLHVDESLLEGKTVLDVGAADAQFGEYVERKFPGTTVIRFDLFLRNDVNEPKRIDFRAIAAQLPIKASSIDLALAHASITNNDGETMLIGLKELFEAVKEGGEIHVAPIFDAPFEFSQERLNLIREYVGDLELKGLAEVAWINDGVEKRAARDGREVEVTRYCLIITKTQ